MTGMERQALAWRYGAVSVEALGGMVGPTLVLLPGGRQVAPFQVAPWFDEPEAAALPGILRQLRGEWPCIPFGADEDRAPIGGWPGSRQQDALDSFAHGYGSHAHWQLEAPKDGVLRLTLAYPEDHPIERLERTIRPDPDAAALDFELTVQSRQDYALPIGLHPTFRLPPEPGSATLEVEGSVRSATLPFDLDASSIFAPDQVSARWNEVALRSGDTLDVSRLPLPEATENLLQLLDMPGHIALHNHAEHYRVRLSWNAEHFPSTLLWFSNRGRRAFPWSGRHLALGIEPVCSAFDLGPQISAAPNPLNRLGVRTVHHFRANQPFSTRYRIAIEAA